MIRRPPRSTPLSLHDALPICLRGAVKIFKLLLRERERAQAAADEDPGLVNVILPNGSRYYVDHAHPEYSSPECSNARDAVVWDKAGERILEQSMDAARHLVPQGQSVFVYKNNSDGKGNSYGCHEN